MRCDRDFSTQIWGFKVTDTSVPVQELGPRAENLVVEYDRTGPYAEMGVRGVFYGPEVFPPAEVGYQPPKMLYDPPQR